MFVKTLLAKRVAGRWNSTQENCVVLLALREYFSVYEREVPEFTSKAFIDDKYLFSSSFSGRSVDTKEISVPISFFFESNKANEEKKGKEEVGGEEKKEEEAKEKLLVITKEGKGRLYYRMAMNYSPRDLFLKARNRGFQSVKRTFESVEDPEDVNLEDDVYKVKAGKKVRVVIEFTSAQRRYHVSLLDYLPGGLEQINLSSPQVDKPRHLSNEEFFYKRNPFSYCFIEPSAWFEHYNMRDERTEAFASVLHQGKYYFKYIVIATTKGEFIAPPAKVECMYTPEIFGRTATQKLVVY